jgi:hypothetical protein
LDNADDVPVTAIYHTLARNAGHYPLTGNSEDPHGIGDCDSEVIAVGLLVADTPLDVGCGILWNGY